MPTQERMTIEERLKYLRIMRPHYKQANLKQRSQLLNEMERVIGLQRKTLIRRMNGILIRKSRTRKSATGLFSAFLVHLLLGASLLSWLQAWGSSYQMLPERATGPISIFNYGWDTLLDRGDEVSLLLRQSLIP